MKNKKVIRKVPKAGEFTTTQHSVLYDKRLSSTAYRILTSILADKDDYKLTQGLIVKRFGYHKDTVKSAFENMEDCGYLRRKELKRGHYYTVSEYGNLNKDKSTTPSEPTSGTTNDDRYLEYETKLNDYIEKQGDYMQITHIKEKVMDILRKYLVDGKLTSYHDPKNDIEKLITKEKQTIYKECMEITNKIDKHTSKKAITEYSNWLKDLIFEKNNLQFNHKSMWLKKKAKHRHYKTDHETMMRDLAEERYYDGDSD